MAGHERKHNACRADIGGCVCGDTYISSVKTPHDVSRRLAEECSSQTQADTRPQGRRTHGQRSEALFPGGLPLNYELQLLVCVREMKPAKLPAQKCCIALGPSSKRLGQKQQVPRASNGSLLHFADVGIHGALSSIVLDLVTSMRSVLSSLT